MDFGIKKKEQKKHNDSSSNSIQQRYQQPLSIASKATNSLIFIP